MSSQPFRILSIVDRHRIQQENMLLFESLLDFIARSDDRLKANYRREHMDLEGHLALDLLIHESGAPVAFSGLYNGGRYPAGVFRALNRTYVHPDFRARHGEYVNWNSKFILPRQLERFANEVKIAFVSRENPEGLRFLKLWTKKWAPLDGWVVSEGMIHVVPHSIEAPAFQHIAMKEFSHIDWQPPQISPQEWRSRYE